MEGFQTQGKVFEFITWLAKHSFFTVKILTFQTEAYVPVHLSTQPNSDLLSSKGPVCRLKSQRKMKSVRVSYNNVRSGNLCAAC